MTPNYLSYLATTLVLIGVYYISKPKLRGQYIMLLADAIWFSYALLTMQYALAVQSLVLFAISCTAVVNWKKAGIKL